MALTIAEDSISSDRTAHTARLASGQDHRWEVSWLPGRYVDRNSAITAMVLADVTGPGDMHAGHRDWIFVEGWAAELGLTAGDVLARTASPPGWAEAGEKAAVPDLEAEP